jgi:hypothetical protein
MRAWLAGLLAVCALIGIPRLVNEIRGQRPPAAAAMEGRSGQPSLLSHYDLAPGPFIRPSVASIVPVSMRAAPVYNAPLRAFTAGHLNAAIKKDPAAPFLFGTRAVPAGERLPKHNVSASPHSRRLAHLVLASQAPGALPPETVRRAHVRASSPAKPASLSLTVREERSTKPPSVIAKQNAPQELAAPTKDYLPPWMRGEPGRARAASSRELRAKPDVEPERENTFRQLAAQAERPKLRRHRPHRAERAAPRRGHYASYRGYYSYRRVNFFPF